MKKRRDSIRWWRRIQSRKHRPTLIKKMIYVVLLTAAIVFIKAVYTTSPDTLGMIWAIWFCVIVIPDGEKENISQAVIENEESHWLKDDEKDPLEMEGMGLECLGSPALALIVEQDLRQDDKLSCEGSAAFKELSSRVLADITVRK